MPIIINKNKEKTKILKINILIKLCLIAISTLCIKSCFKLSNEIRKVDNVKVEVIDKKITRNYNQDSYILYYKAVGNEIEHQMEITESAYNDAKIGGTQWYRLSKLDYSDKYYYHDFYIILYVLITAALIITCFVYNYERKERY